MSPLEYRIALHSSNARAALVLQSEAPLGELPQANEEHAQDILAKGRALARREIHAD